MPAAKEDNTVSGLEKFTKTFWPYILLAIGLIQYIYTREMAQNQSVFVEIRDEQKKGNAKMAEVLLMLTVHGGDIERLKKSDDKQESRLEQLEKRQNDLEKSVILSNGGRR